MKHTQGEWIFSDYWIWRSHDEISKNAQQSPQIAYVGYGHDEQGNLSEQQTANAKLIAAAPDLLNALQGLIDDIKSKPNDTRYSTHLQIAYAAIKKATK